MCIRILSLSIKPKEVLEILMSEIDGDLIHYEYIDIENHRGFGYVIFEKFYTQSKSKKMIVVNTQNIEELTNATIVLSPDDEESMFRLDFETDDMCIEEIMEILDPYMIDERDG